MNPQDENIIRGILLLGFGAIISLLQLVLPAAAPIALGVYGAVQGLNRRLPLQRRLIEALVAIAIAVVLWLIREPLGWLLWGLGATMAGAGLYCFLNGLFSPRRKASPSPEEMQK